MAIYFKKQNALLLLVPKTGSTWIRKVLEGFDIEYELVGDETRRHHDLLCEFEREKYNYIGAFIRNPIDWFHSYWAYRQERGWRNQYDLDRLCENDDYELFIRKVVSTLPGALTKIFSTYIGKKSERIDFVGRQENLAHDLHTFLKNIGISVPLDELVSTNKINATKTKASVSNEIRELISVSEWETMTEFGYVNHDSDKFRLQDMVNRFPNDFADLRHLILWTEQIHWVHDDKKRENGVTINPLTRYARVASNFALFAQSKRSDVSYAQKKFREALGFDPAHPRTLCNYALFLWKNMGDTEKARSTMEKALVVRPNHPYTLGKYARLIRFVDGNIKKAAEYYEKSLELAPNQMTLRKEYNDMISKIALEESL